MTRQPHRALSASAFAVLGLVVCLAGPSWAAGEKTTAIPVNDFLNSVGICTHMTQGEDDPAKVAECLAYAGIRGVRDDGTTNPRTLDGFVHVHQACGARMVVLPVNGDIAASLHEYETLAAAGALLAVEGPNEPNNFRVNYQGHTSSKTTSMPVALFQRDLYAAVKADPRLAGIAVFHTSEAGGSEPDNCGLQFLTIPEGANALLPAGTTFADFANVHNYVCGHGLKGITQDNIAWQAEDPTLNGEWDGLYVEYGHTWWGKGFDGYAKSQLEKLPRVTTETGWTTHEGPGGNGAAITEQQQARLFLNLYLDACTRGWRYTFIYMLRDSPGQGAWGLFHHDNSPKASATCLHNLTAILADKPTDDALAGQLDFMIPNGPAAVHHLLMQKHDGTFELAIWGEHAQGSSDVTVNLASRASVKVYDPTVGVDPMQTLSDVGAVPLTLSDHPLIVAIERAK